MEKEVFEKLMSMLLKRVKACETYLTGLDSMAALKKKSFEEYREIIEFCESEYPISTQICMVDLYHIVGMGELSPIQLSKFLKPFKYYVSFRPIIKDLATRGRDIFDLPDISKVRSYHLSDAFSNIRLGEISKIVEEEISGTDELDWSCSSPKLQETKSKLTFKNFVFDYGINRLLIPIDKFTEALEELRQINAVTGLSTADTAAAATKIKTKIAEETTIKFFGITWAYCDEIKTIYGKLTDSNAISKLRWVAMK